MLVRIITSIVGLVLFALVIAAPPAVLSAALFVLVGIMLWEIYGVMEAKKQVIAVGYLTEVLMVFSFLTDKNSFILPASLMLFMLLCVLMHGRETAERVMSQGLVTVFVTTAMFSLILIRNAFGMYAVLLPFVIAWLTDTGAYFAGSLFGKHKLVPQISPKKTVEGAIGGLVLASAGTVGFGLIFAEQPADVKYIVIFLLMGIIGSVLSQLGDLAASCIKRDFGKKDYGNILPGHGGAMDRFDSVIFAAPFVYYVLEYLIRASFI